MTTLVVNNLVFKGFFKKQILTGPKFIDWYQQLRIVLLVEDKLDYLEQPIPPAPVPAQAGQQVAPEALAAHAAWKLKTLFAQQAEQEILQTLKDFHSCKQEEGYLILISLRKEFDSFVQNYNMHGMGKTVNDLQAMLKLHEQTLTKKDPALHAIWAGKVRKFISRLGVVLTIKEPININYENTGAITIANESGITKGARHFRAKVHYLREVIKYGDIKLEKVHICAFTKSLAFPKHSEHTKNIRMLPASSLM
ncbi:hypothetical protein Tco_1344089 [Tanacetum coccineum]